MAKPGPTLQVNERLLVIKLDFEQEMETDRISIVLTYTEKATFNVSKISSGFGMSAGLKCRSAEKSAFVDLIYEHLQIPVNQ